MRVVVCGIEVVFGHRCWRFRTRSGNLPSSGQAAASSVDGRTSITITPLSGQSWVVHGVSIYLVKIENTEYELLGPLLVESCS